MSKSLGNFVTIRDLLSEFNGEVIRYALIQHIMVLNFHKTLLDKKSLSRLYRAVEGFSVDGEADALK